jgi:uncharacterized protein YacL
VGKLWRLIFTVLATVAIVLMGWFAADAALHWFAADTDLSRVFTPVWVQVVYRVTYLLAGIVFGVALGRGIFRKVEQIGESLGKMSVRDKVALSGGLIIGIILSAIVSLPIIFTVGSSSKVVAVVLALLLGVMVTYLCTAAALSMKEEIHFYMPPPAEEEKVPAERFKILDTNVIIDGRIADVARAGFLEGTLYVPGFVLEELQHIADSADGLRRARGRRGLDVLRNLQVEQQLTVRTYDKLAPAGESVDSRLVRLAKALNGSIVTNDWNLNKVARIQDVPVLNINELANALKPVVLPGEQMRVTVVKEGKEPGQGVGYLDDGTMVVVEGGRRHLGETVPIGVTSVLQTQAGKMIFAQVEGEGGNGRRGSGGAPRPDGGQDDDNEDDGDEQGDDGERTDDADAFLDAAVNHTNGANNGANGGAPSYERNVRSYTGRRPRRPVR